MTILPIVIAPDPLLKQRSAPIEKITDDIKALSKDMFDTMYASHGIGLAAVQVGHLKRMIVVDTEWTSRGDEDAEINDDTITRSHPIVLINPDIIEESEELRTYDEGCLSFPGQQSEVTRPDHITIAYTDLDGTPQTLKADGLLATCIQHEIDHMNGVVFIDHVSRMKRDMIMRRLKKQQRLQSHKG